jgi:hypothetical protein
VAERHHHHHHRHHHLLLLLLERPSQKKAFGAAPAPLKPTAAAAPTHPRATHTPSKSAETATTADAKTACGCERSKIIWIIGDRFTWKRISSSSSNARKAWCSYDHVGRVHCLWFWGENNKQICLFWQTLETIRETNVMNLSEGRSGVSSMAAWTQWLKTQTQTQTQTNKFVEMMSGHKQTNKQRGIVGGRAE